MAAEDREKQFERALSRHFSSASPDSACPDAEILAAYHERTLSPEEMTQWKDHIASCARCQESLTLVEQTENLPAEDWERTRDLVSQDDVLQRPPVTRAPVLQPTQSYLPRRTLSPSSAPSAAVAAPQVISQPKRRPPLRWIVPLGAIAAAVIVWIGVGEIRNEQAKKMQSAQIAENRNAPAPQLTLPSSTQQSPALEDSGRDSSMEAVQRPKVAVPSPTRVPPKQPPTSLVAQGAAPVRSAPRNQLARKNETAPPAGGMGGIVAAPASPAPPLNGRALNAGTSTDANGRATNAATSTPASAPTADFAQPSPNASPAAALAKEQSKKAQEQAVAANSASQSVTVTYNPSNLEVLDAEKALTLQQLAQVNRLYIVAPGEKHAWRVGNAGKIERSTDSGKTWKPQDSGVSADLTAGSATSDKVCWVVGKAGTLLVTSDGGKHWTQVTAPIAGDLGGVHATDATHASIWDVPNRQSYQTSDGGITWTRSTNE
jgi:hypothetical protein